MRKAQVSTEFIFAFGIILVIFIAMFGFMINRSRELVESETELNKDNTCLLVSSLLTSAFVGGDGIVINASIDHNLTINVTGNNTNYLGIAVENSSYCFLTVHNVQRTKLEEGVIRIENQDNLVDIENV